MLKILKYLKRKEWFWIGFSLLFIMAQVVLDLKIPDYMSSITRHVQTPGSSLSDVWLSGGKMLLCALGSFAAAVIVGFISSQIAARFSLQLRTQVYDKVTSFSTEEINRFSTASLINRSTNDVTQVQMFVTLSLQLIIKAPIMAWMAIGKISTKSWQWSALTAGVILFLLIIILFLMVYALPRFKKIQTLMDDLNRVTREQLNGLLVVRAYNAEAYHEEKFNEANQALTSNNLKANAAMTVINPAMNVSMNALTLGIYWIGACLISDITIRGMADISSRVAIFSDMVVFMSYAMQVVMSFMMLVMIFILLPRASVSAKRIIEVIETSASIVSGNEEKGDAGQTGCVEFRNVSFQYPDAAEPVIRNISFYVKKGETLALIGATGCGKSTIVNLIPRMFDATEGEILVEGVNVKDYALNALNDKIGFIPQKAFLFSGTIQSNIGYSLDNPTVKQLSHAASIAQAQDFIESGDDGYAGLVAQSGSNLSGGQKQRLSIARAVAKNPPIFVFDDSFSALDYQTDRKLRTALKTEVANATQIIVAQRIGTIMDADQILVIDDGSIVGRGTHKELLKHCDVYREIALSQLSEEEIQG